MSRSSTLLLMSVLFGAIGCDQQMEIGTREKPAPSVDEMELPVAREILRQDVKRLKQEEAELRRLLRQHQNRVTEAKADLRTLDGQARALRRQLENQRSELANEIQGLKIQRDSLQKVVVSLRQEMEGVRAELVEMKREMHSTLTVRRIENLSVETTARKPVFSRKGSIASDDEITPPAPLTIESDSSGGATIQFMVPGAPEIIRTELNFEPGEACYVRTLGEVKNLRVGGHTREGTRWSRIPAWELRCNAKMTNETDVEAELVFWAANVPPGEYTIRVRRCQYRLKADEAAPGVKLRRRYGFD